MPQIPAKITGRASPKPEIHGMIDAHAHHNNGATCPLPLLYNQLPITVNRWSMESAETFIWGAGIVIKPFQYVGFSMVDPKAIKIQRLATVEMGNYLAELNTQMANNVKNASNNYQKYKKLSKIREEKKKLLKGRVLENPEQELQGEEKNEWNKLKEEENIQRNKLIVSGPNIIPGLVIVPTMDMELAHIDGYSGEFIYRQDGYDVVYYKRRNGILYERGDSMDISHVRKSKEDIEQMAKAQEIDVEKLDDDDKLIFQNWKQQVSDTEAAAAGNPLRHFPLFFYDPRRYRYPCENETTPAIKNCGQWDDPFARIVGHTRIVKDISENSRVWLGFKMYPSLGYRPFDERYENLPRFYHECEDKKIPILTHCAPGGMTTHDAQFYEEFDKDIDRKEKGKKRHTMILKTWPKTEQKTLLCSDTYQGKDETDKKPKLNYFFKTYGHPENWRTVLKYFPELHLCLAHFGGDNEWKHKSMTKWAKGSSSDSPLREWIHSILELTYKYDNVYTDISCLNIFNRKIKRNLKCMLSLINEQSLTDTKQRFSQILLNGDKVDNPFKHLKNKLIFGSDWYLTYLTPIAKNAKYGKYCNAFKDLFDEVDRTGELWEHVSLLNPWKCYSLSMKKFEDMRKILPNLAREMRVGLKSGAEYETFKKLKELYCDHIKKKLNPQDPCEYESTCRKDPKPCK